MNSKASNREFNRTIDDPCAIQQKVDDNEKKLKFVTTNFKDLLDGKKELNFFGMTVKDQLFVPSDKVTVYNDLLSGKTGSIMTNFKFKENIGQLPFPTMPSRYQLSRGDVVIEDCMRNLYEDKKNSCNPRENEYHNRSFYIFNEKAGIEVPNPVKSVEPDEFGKRGGIGTRFLAKKKRM